MVTSVTVKTQKLTRDKLAEFLPNHELIRAFENLTSDVSVTIPELVQQALDSAAAALAAAATLAAIAYVEVGTNAATPRARSLVVDPSQRLKITDAGPGNTITVDLNLDHVNAWTKNQSTAQVQLVDAVPVAVDASLSNSFRLLTTAAIGATRMLANPTNLTPGMLLVFAFQQPAVGGPCALTFDTLYDFGPASTPSLSTGANAIDLMLAYWDGTKLCCWFRAASSAGGSLTVQNASGSITGAATTLVVPDALLASVAAGTATFGPVLTPSQAQAIIQLPNTL